MSTAVEPAPLVNRNGSADAHRASRTASTHPRRRDWGLVGLWIALVIAAVIWIVPFLFMFITIFSGASGRATSRASWRRF